MSPNCGIRGRGIVLPWRSPIIVRNQAEDRIDDTARNPFPEPGRPNAPIRQTQVSGESLLQTRPWRASPRISSTVMRVPATVGLRITILGSATISVFPI